MMNRVFNDSHVTFVEPVILENQAVDGTQHIVLRGKQLLHAHQLAVNQCHQLLFRIQRLRGIRHVLRFVERQFQQFTLGYLGPVGS